jgi:RNA polymerase I-specific transcription initiation factor RRN3
MPLFCIQIFDVLMHSFQSTILDTFKLKFTQVSLGFLILLYMLDKFSSTHLIAGSRTDSHLQFLIFYVCSVAPTTCGAKFAAVLCDALTSTNRAPTSR